MSTATTHIETEKHPSELSRSKLVPAIRFKEFEGEWEKHSLKYLLGSLVDCEHKTAPYIDESDYLVVRTNNVKGGQLVYDDIKYTTEDGFNDWTKRSVPQSGDILFTREAPAGESCLVPKDKKVCLGQRMVLLKSDENKMTGQYLSSYLQSGSAIRDISNLSIGTTVTRINIADIYKLKCPVSTIPEQQKIASFLSAVDEKIQQLTKKKALLEQYKKGVMQQLFSQKLRFKDENGNPYPDWEEKRLGEYLVHKSTRNKDLEVELVLSVSNKKGFISQNEQFDGYEVASRDLSNYKIVERDNIAYNPSRINVGSIARLINFEKGIVSPMYVIFSLKNGLNKIFFENLYDTHRFKHLIKVGCSGSVRDSLNFDDLCDFEFKFPSLEEQQKIATYLSSIDTKIESVTNQIDQTQTFKKGLLQQMFV